MTGTIGFIIPAFNAGATLERTLNSVRAQTSVAWTVVVVDDGSTDETAAIAARAAASDPRISVLRQVNGGPSSARNAGLKATEAEFVTFLDADDTLATRYVERMVARLRRSPGAAGVCCGSVRRSKDGRPTSRSLPQGLAVDARLACRPGVPAPIHALLINRALVIALGGFDEELRAFEDWDLWIRIVQFGAEIVVLPSILVTYWSRIGQASRDGAMMLRHHAVVLDRSRCLIDDAAPSDQSFELNRLAAVLWSGGASIGAGDDARPLAMSAPSLSEPPWDHGGLAIILLHGLSVGAECRLVDIVGRWSSISTLLTDFLGAVEAAAGWKGLAYLLLKSLEREAIRCAPIHRATLLSRTLAVPRRQALLRSIWAAPPGCDSLIVKLHGARIVEAAMIGNLDARELRSAAVDQALDQLWRSRAAQQLEHRVPVGRRVADRLRRLGRMARRRLPQSSANPTAPKIIPAPDHGGLMTEIAAEESVAAAKVVVGSATDQSIAQRAPEPYGGEGQDSSTVWDKFFEQPDPWAYDTPYEQNKYDLTLRLALPAHIGRALELACAEGRFTERLAPRVERLQAVDISSVALSRAAERCSRYTNIDYVVQNFFEEDFGSNWDLIVCSEVLYYLNLKEKLAPFACKVKASLAPGGFFIHTHAKALVDNPKQTGFDWAVPFGGDAIAKTLENTSGLQRIRSLHTALYRIDLFQKIDDGETTAVAPLEETAALACRLEPRVARQVIWNGLEVAQEALALHIATRIPVLMYHRVAATGPAGLAPYRVTPDEFEAQLLFLRRRGFYTTTLTDWRRATRGHALRGRPLMITFDDAYADFAELAWPLLERYDFSAHVFVPTDKVGMSADWDVDYGDAAPLMDWGKIAALFEQGVTFGSHLASHPWAPFLDSKALFREAIRSKAALESALGCEITSVAPPFGATNARVASVLRLAGYREGFLDRGGLAQAGHLGLNTNRVEVRGGAGITAFAESLGMVVESPNARDEPVGVAGIIRI